jgi:hypothetical protein
MDVSYDKVRPEQNEARRFDQLHRTFNRYIALAISIP